MAAKLRPFEVALSAEKRKDLALSLARSLDDALSARTVSERDVEYFWTLYEQGRTRGAVNRPWADAADLTSYLGTQYVDVMRASIVKTAMVDPVWTVEGYGEAAKNAPFVEEFHQWQQELEGFQGVFSRAVHMALIEPYGCIEVYEDTIKRPVRSIQRVALALAPDGSALLGDDMQPILQQNANGSYVQVYDPNIPSAEIEVDTLETASRGPRERAIPYRDYLQLPGHARDKSELWGHAKRFSRRVEELQERADAKLYDAEAVESLGTDDERTSVTSLTGAPIDVAAKDDPDRSEKELWEILFLRDLDGKGLRWFVATLHKDQQTLLRLQYDDIGRSRFFPLIPFPRPSRTEGYSYIGHKLITVIEEHTAWRNMLADRAAMQLSAPIMKLHGALWDPDVEPIGPKAVLTVRDMREVRPMQFPDQTSPAIERIRDCERTGERLSGINDVSAGVTSQEQRTLGEVQLVTAQSQGRVSEAVKNIQETLEEICQVRHLMWKRALADLGAEGLEAPASVTQAIELRTQAPPMPPSDGGTLVGTESRGADISGQSPQGVRFTAQMLEGVYRFKPRGSVETADLNRQRYDFNQFVVSMSNMARINPMVLAMLQTPEAAKALIEQGVRLHNVQDKQAFLGSEAMAAAQQAMQMRQMQTQAGGVGGAGGPGGPTPTGPTGAGPDPSVPPPPGGYE